MVAALPLTIGRAHQHVAVAATPTVLQSQLPERLEPGDGRGARLAFVSLIGSVVGLVVSNRRVARELSTDSLTSLRNRRALMEDLPRVCQRATEDDPAYLWFFDLNGFKRYNDSFGHVAGDSLLARLGDRLRETVKHCGDRLQARRGRVLRARSRARSKTRTGSSRRLATRSPK